MSYETIILIKPSVLLFKYIYYYTNGFVCRAFSIIFYALFWLRSTEFAIKNSTYVLHLKLDINHTIVQYVDSNYVYVLIEGIRFEKSSNREINFLNKVRNFNFHVSTLKLHFYFLLRVLVV